MLVSGITESRLEEITPLGQEPTEGRNGVTQITEDYIRYRIGAILYEDRADGTTVYKYYPQRPIGYAGSFVSLPFDTSYLGVDGSRINVIRSGVPAFQTIFNLEILEDSDLEAFPQNFF